MKKKDDNQMNEKFQNFLKEGFASDEEIIAPHRVKGKQNKGAIGWITNKLKRDIAGPVGGDEQPIKAPDCKGGTSKEGKWTVSSDGQYTHGLDSPTNPESLVNMLKKVGLEDEQVQQLIMKICGLASDSNIPLEEEVTLSGSNSEKDRIMKSNNVQHLMDFIKKLDLDADKNNQLLKILNIWGSSNTVKFDSTGGRRSSSSDERPASYDYKRDGMVDDSEEKGGETGLSGGAVYHCDDGARNRWNDQQKKHCAAQAAAAAKEANASDTDDNRAADIDPSAEKPATTDAEKALQELANMRFEVPTGGDPEELGGNRTQFRSNIRQFQTLLRKGVSRNNETPGVDNNEVGRGGGTLFSQYLARDFHMTGFDTIFTETVEGDETPGEAFDQLRFTQQTDKGMIKKINDNFVEIINKQMDYLIEAAIVKLTKSRDKGDRPVIPPEEMPFFLWLFPGIDRYTDQRQPGEGFFYGDQTAQDLVDKRDALTGPNQYRHRYMQAVMGAFEGRGFFARVFNPEGGNKEFTIDPEPFSEKALKNRLKERYKLRKLEAKAAKKAEKEAKKAAKNEATEKNPDNKGAKSAISPEAQALIAKRKKKGKFIPYFEESQNNQKIKTGRLHESYRREKDEEIYAKLMEKFLK